VFDLILRAVGIQAFASVDGTLVVLTPGPFPRAAHVVGADLDDLLAGGHQHDHAVILELANLDIDKDSMLIEGPFELEMVLAALIVNGHPFPQHGIVTSLRNQVAQVILGPGGDTHNGNQADKNQNR